MKKWAVYDPGAGGLDGEYETEGEAIAAANKAIGIYRHEGTDGEWGEGVEGLMVLEIKHHVTDHTPDKDTCDFKLTPAD